MNPMWIKLALVIVVVFGIGLWQVFDINRELRKEKSASDEAE